MDGGRVVVRTRGTNVRLLFPGRGVDLCVVAENIVVVSSATNLKIYF